MARWLIALLTATGAMVLGLPESASALPRRVEVRLYKGGLDFPVDMAWVKGSRRIFFTEKNSGNVRIMQGRRLLSRACVDLDVSTANPHHGALGIALHPRFEKNKWLYVYYTNREPVRNRVTRFKVDRNRCTKPHHILGGLQAHHHQAGQLGFVRGKLLVTTGDGDDPSQSQNVDSRNGKILRLMPNGRIPDDNPFGESPVWAYGLRNPFGLATKPGTPRVFVTDNGPECDDKLFRARRGRNHGWGPNYQCGGAVGPNPVHPLIRWGETIIPTDPAWYMGKLRVLRNNLIVPAFNGELRKIIMNRRGSRVREDRIIYRHPEGIVDVSQGPGGWLYFLTTDGIFRVVRRRERS